MTAPQVKDFDYDKLEIGEELGSYEYTLTQEMLDNFRASVDGPGGGFSPPWRSSTTPPPSLWCMTTRSER